MAEAAYPDAVRKFTCRRHASLFSFAPGGVYTAFFITEKAVGFYSTISPLPYYGGIFSVALSLKQQLLLRRTLSGTLFPWSPDFPLLDT